MANRSMASKIAKAKKCMMEEVMDNAKCEMCCKTIPNKVHDYGKPYSASVFNSKYAVQKRIDVFVIYKGKRFY